MIPTFILFETGTRFSELTQLLLNPLVPPGPDLPVSGQPLNTVFFKEPVLRQLLLNSLVPPGPELPVSGQARNTRGILGCAELLRANGQR